MVLIREIQQLTKQTLNETDTRVCVNVGDNDNPLKSQHRNKKRKRPFKEVESFKTVNNKRRRQLDDLSEEIDQSNLPFKTSESNNSNGNGNGNCNGDGDNNGKDSDYINDDSNGNDSHPTTLSIFKQNRDWQMFI